MTRPDSAPATLRCHYSAFLRGNDVWLTGHSHQAWPDVARHGLELAFDDAAAFADLKWERAFAAAASVREAVAERIGANADEIALGNSTHDLVVRFLSALDLRGRRHVVTTSGEFHTIDRQLRRLAEAGLDVTFVDASPADSLAARLCEAIRADTAAVFASTVLFESSTIVQGLASVVARARELGAWPLLDAYHAVGVVPTSLETYGDDAFLVGGGYKYLQWGEGACFMRVPPTFDRTPVVTGWFADFEHLSAPRGGRVAYGSRGFERFAGATYDPSSHYRARAVIDFFREMNLTVDALRAISSRQTQRIVDAMTDHDVVSPRNASNRGGFVAVRVADAPRTVAAMAARGVRVDCRGDIVRLGPAPYLTDEEIDRGVRTFIDESQIR